MSLAISDYFVKSGNTKLSNIFIKKGSYRASLDLIVAGTFQNALGDTVERYFPHKQLNVSWSVSGLDQIFWEELLGFFTAHFIAGTHDIEVTCWVPTESAYVTQICTVEGLGPVLDALSTRHAAIYGEQTIRLIGKGGATT